jgi:DNA-nicking Smr family endonuclease
MEPVKIPIEDALDLHTFLPRDIPDLIEDYLTECLKAGFHSVRIIHGKGKGVQKGAFKDFFAKTRWFPHLRMRRRRPGDGEQHWLN